MWDARLQLQAYPQDWKLIENIHIRNITNVPSFYEAWARMKTKLTEQYLKYVNQTAEKVLNWLDVSR